MTVSARMGPSAVRGERHRTGRQLELLVWIVLEPRIVFRVDIDNEQPCRQGFIPALGRERSPHLDAVFEA